jgi:hypothetical protein
MERLDWDGDLGLRGTRGVRRRPPGSNWVFSEIRWCAEIVEVISSMPGAVPMIFWLPTAMATAA